MNGLLAAAAPYSIARRGAAAQRLKHELSHMSDTTSSSIEWHEDLICLGLVSHGGYNLSNRNTYNMGNHENPQKPLLMNRNLWLLIIVCIVGTMITSLWLAYTPNSFFGKVDAIGYAVCHRIPSHSFTVAGKPMPLCARCSGMYLGAFFSIIYQMIGGKRRGGFSRKALFILCIFACLLCS